MAKRVQHIRHTESTAATFLGRDGEITADSDNDVLILHDNAKAGGHRIAREDLINAPAATVAAAGKMTVQQVIDLAAAKVIADTIEKQVGGFLTKNISGGISLTDAEADNLIIKFTGGLSANATIQFPDTSGIHYVINATTGGFNLFCNTVTGIVNIEVKNGSTGYMAADDQVTKELFEITTAYSSRGLIRGLPVKYNGGNDKIEIGVGTAVDDTGSYIMRQDVVDLSCDLDIAGVGGLDTGSKANNTGYYVFLIGDNTDTNAPKLLASLSLKTPTIPAGYNKKILFFFIHTDSIGNLYPFSAGGDIVRYNQGFDIGSGTFSSPAVSSSQDIPSQIPIEMCSSWYLNVVFQLSTELDTEYIGKFSANNITPLVANNEDIRARSNSESEVRQSVELTIPVGSNFVTKRLTWALNTSSVDLTMLLHTTGFKINRELDVRNLP